MVSLQQVVTDLTYSRVKKSLLGCCSEGGAVALYDTHANKVVHSFSDAHSFAANAISFSPVNEFLMVSVGYDKKLCCFNVQSRQWVDFSCGVVVLVCPLSTVIVWSCLFIHSVLLPDVMCTASIFKN